MSGRIRGAGRGGRIEPGFQIQTHHLGVRRHKIEVIALDGWGRTYPEIIRFSFRGTADKRSQFLARLLIETHDPGIGGRIARRADENPPLTHHRTAEGIGVELGDPFDILGGGQIHFAIGFFGPESIPFRQSLLSFGGHIARRLSAPRRPIGGTHRGCRGNQRQQHASQPNGSARRDSSGTQLPCPG